MEEDCKKCSDCKEDLPRARFGKNRARPDGLSNICKACAVIRSRKWRLADPGRAAKFVRDSQARKRKAVA